MRQLSGEMRLSPTEIVRSPFPISQEPSPVSLVPKNTAILALAARHRAFFSSFRSHRASGDVIYLTIQALALAIS